MLQGGRHYDLLNGIAKHLTNLSVLAHQSHNQDTFVVLVLFDEVFTNSVILLQKVVHNLQGIVQQHLTVERESTTGQFR